MAQRLTTHAGMFTALAAALAAGKHAPFEFAVVDEAQDISVAHLRFLAAVGASRPDALFFAGDLGQRIFQQPFSWKSLGVDIRGRSRTLRINYRTSHQIRQQADRLLGPQATDVDGNSETRSDTVSVFNGPPPVIRVLGSERDEATSWARGWPGSRRPAFCRRSSASSFARWRRWRARKLRSSKPGCSARCLMSMSRPAAGMSRSAPCTWPRAWNSGRWW